jgi:hypothetical protein
VVNSLPEDRLIHDWAAAVPAPATPPMLDDETLRDGLQSPSVQDPPIETKLRILHLMDALGIETADVGLPGAGPRQRDAVTALCREIERAGLRIRANCAARTMVVDIQPIADVVQQTGVPIEACVFIGSSPIRQYAEEWELEHVLRHTREAVAFAVSEGLEVMYVTEDTIRASPDHLRILFTAAVDAGARRLCLCDTVGAAVPEGVTALTRWVAGLLEELGVADRVYSGVPAGWIGRQQEIEVGHMSGGSNVQYFLRGRGITPTPAMVDAVLALAKRSERLLTEDEILEVARSAGLPV